MMTSDLAQPFGLYIHWPYCVSKCPYCDFNSHVAQRLDHELWAKCYESELRRIYEETSSQTISSIFFGGGTPSLMAPQTVQRVIDCANTLWGLSETVEITLEANPTTVETNTFRDFKQAGVNRLSIGIQSLNDDVLKFLGRAHDVGEGLRALDLAQKTFDRYSFDLIYARADQTIENWAQELDQALSLSGGHLSLYQLTIEPGTPFYKNNIPCADEDLGADLYDFTQSRMEEAGLPAYEISNHARKGEESRHNLIYWQGDDYAGIGPGAHSRLNNQAIHQIYKPDLWLKAVTETGSGEQKRKALSADERVIEMLMMGLRLRDGIEIDKFKRISGRDLFKSIDLAGLDLLKDVGLVQQSSTHLKASPQGLACLDGVLEKLIR